MSVRRLLPVPTRGFSTALGNLTDLARRWFDHLDRAVNEGTYVVGQTSARVSTDMSATLQTADRLPKGTYRFTLGLRGVSGQDPTGLVIFQYLITYPDLTTETGPACRLDFTDDGGVAGWKTFTMLQPLTQTGAVIGYQVFHDDAAGDPYTVDLLFVVEALPETRRIG